MKTSTVTIVSGTPAVTRAFGENAPARRWRSSASPVSRTVAGGRSCRRRAKTLGAAVGSTVSGFVRQTSRTPEGSAARSPLRALDTMLFQNPPPSAPPCVGVAIGTICICKKPLSFKNIKKN